jgi:hypothetical protein
MWTYSPLHEIVCRLIIKGKNVFETLEVSQSMPNLIPLYVNQNAVYLYTAYSEGFGIWKQYFFKHLCNINIFTFFYFFFSISLTSKFSHWYDSFSDMRWSSYIKPHKSTKNVKFIFPTFFVKMSRLFFYNLDELLASWKRSFCYSLSFIAVGKTKRNEHQPFFANLR